MELSNKQTQLINASFGQNTLIQGYSGVGKSTVLLKKYEALNNDRNVSKNEIVLIVSNELKKQVLLHQYARSSAKYNFINVMTMNELIDKYLKRIELDLFQNTIDASTKKLFIKDVIREARQDEYDFSLEFIMEEINYIQENICRNEQVDMDILIHRELKTYLNTPRKSVRKGLLLPREKEFIFKIYTNYLYKALDEDFFDQQTFYQSYLRLIYNHYIEKDLSMQFSILLIDDIQDFTKVQCEIIYYLYDQSQEKHMMMITLDELKSKDRYLSFKNSALFQAINNSMVLEINYRNSRNVFNIMKSNLSNNDLIHASLSYKSAYNNNKNDNKSVLTYFYNKSVDEKREVFFDRLDLLINSMKYRLNDILIVFFNQANLLTIKQDCVDNDLLVLDIYDHIEKPEIEGLTFVYKEDLVNTEFKVVVLYDAENKICCSGPVNKIINVNKNYEDSIYFYIALSNAKDFLIINSSRSEPSHLLLPSHIDYSQFIFEVGSKFQMKSTLNVYRISDFILWIKENLVKQYEYSLNDFTSQPNFDLVLDVNYSKIGFKILDNNIDNTLISEILKKGKELTHIVIFDSHHYLTFKNLNQEFIRVVDIPSK